MKRGIWNHVIAWTAMFAILGTGRAGAQGVRTGTDAWKSIGPQGGRIGALSVDPHHPRTLYVASGSGVAFKSLDGGTKWVKSGVPNRPLIFDPQDPNTIYAISPSTAEGISKSADGGTSWNPANSGLPLLEVLALAIDPLNPFTLFAGTQYGISKSTDGGVSWSTANSGLPLYSSSQIRYAAGRGLVIDPQDPRTVYSVVDHLNGPGDLLFKSTDGGGTWNLVGSGLPESDIILAIDPQNPRTLYAGTYCGVFKSTDRGAGWSPVNSGLPFQTGFVTSLVIDPEQPDTIYAAIGNLSGGKVFKTTNGGVSWSDASSGLPVGATGDLVVIVIDAADSATLYAGTGVGVYKSSDGGASWVAANSGLTAVYISDVAVDPRNSSTLYAVAGLPYDALLKTTAGGANWSPANFFALAGPLVIDRQNTSTLFAYGCVAVSRCGVVKSTDGGTSFSASWLVQDPADDWISTLAIDPRNSNIVYATTQAIDGCGGETLGKSLDGGMTWSGSLFRVMGVSANCVSALVVDPQNAANLYAAFQLGGLFKSTDAGATWNAANSGLSPDAPSSDYSGLALAIDPGSPSTVYTVSFSGVFKSSDGGMSWSPASSGLPDWSGAAGDCCYFRPRLAVDPQNSARVFLGIAVNGAQHVFQTSDGGASWTDSGFSVASSAGGSWFGGLAISSQGPSTVYASSPGAGVFAFSNTVSTDVHSH